MAGKNITKNLIPNPEWLEISKHRPAWGPWPVTVRATPAFIEQLLTPMENLTPPVRDASVAKFFSAFGRVVSAMPDCGCVEEMNVELLLLELAVEEERVDFLVGVRWCEKEGWYLTVAADWCREDEP